MDTRERIIQIKYVLRHAPLSDGLIDTLTEHIDELRWLYRRNKNEFTEEDIKFLQEIGKLLGALMEYVAFLKRFEILRQYKTIANGIYSASEKLLKFDEEIYSNITRQAEDTINELERLFPHVVEEKAT